MKGAVGDLGRWDWTPEDRARFRRESLAERLARFRELLDTWSTTCRPKSAMGKAITYARGQWDTLVVFLDDGTAPAHNNTSERLLRGPVVGRPIKRSADRRRRIP